MEKNPKTLSKRLMQRFLIGLFVAIAAYVGKELMSYKIKEQKNAREKDVTIALLKILNQIEKEECIKLKNKYWEDHKKTISEIQSLVPYEFNFSDTKNLVNQVNKYQMHIETLLQKSDENSVNEPHLNQNLLEQYRHALHLFESSSIHHKMEFIQCWEYGDDLSESAREYIIQLDFSLAGKIRTTINCEEKIEKEHKARLAQDTEITTKEKKEYEKRINEISDGHL